MGASDPFSNPTLWLPWIWGWGGDLLNKDGSAIAIDQPAGLEALQWQEDLIKRHGVIPSRPELDALKEREPVDNRSLFKNGLVAMYTDFTTAVGAARLREAAQTGLRWDATQLPAGKAGQFGMSYYHPLAVAAATKVPEAAWQVLAFYTGAEPTLRKALAGSSQPFRKSVAASPEYTRTLPPAFGKALVKQGQQSRPYPMVVEDAKLRQLITAEVKLLRDGQKTARDAAQTIKTQGDLLLTTRL